MPTDHLTVAPSRTADAVLAVLSGTPVEVAAAAINVQPGDLAIAVEVYQTAGREALEARTADGGWYHVNLQFPGDTAEQAAAALLQRLDGLREREMIDAWWFIRKHPGWRLRLRPRTGVVSEGLRAATNAVLNDLTVSGVLERWWPAIYEAETASFGGPVGMEIAHELFCADSRRILTHLRQPAPEVGRKELSMMLCSIMLSAAGLDRFERGDLWNRVAELRLLPADTPPGRLEAMADKLRPLVASPLGTITPCGPLAFAESWAIDFRQTGQALREAASAGQLSRGIRHVLTHVVIFHWNRLGLSSTTQAILSRAAREALLPSGS
ncbi:thiopeptide-type bacteriocin biosynthesis protein [Nonomuraea sp. JJY05]|uniref:thiopeptide-type bacteriocin biosynthesis protein n=1 Tax=Nonomuraea sp. JJY05 TaxID=3350255 RepID=UPI00373DF4D6